MSKRIQTDMRLIIDTHPVYARAHTYDATQNGAHTHTVAWNPPNKTVDEIAKLLSFVLAVMMVLVHSSNKWVVRDMQRDLSLRLGEISVSE